MVDDEVLYQRHDRVALVTLNRPDRMNAWTLDMENLYCDLLANADADPDVRAIVVTGAGRTFCVGADLQQPFGGDVPEGRTKHYPDVFAATLRKPIIGAINGSAAGVGLAQSLLFDVRFAAAGSKLTFSFSHRGLIAEYGTSWTLPRLVGNGRALDLLLSSRVVLAQEALELGLVNRVVPGERLLDEALAYAGELAETCSPASIAVIKAQLQRHWSTDLAQAGQECTALMLRSFGGLDCEEGVQSYLQKRPAAFPALGEGSAWTLDA